MGDEDGKCEGVDWIWLAQGFREHENEPTDSVQ